MREYARLTKDLVITGIGLRMELWDADEWAAYEAQQEAAYAAPERGLLGT
jgi:MraZ protein